ERGVLNRREVKTGLPDLGQEHGHRDLLEAARQMAGHLVVVSHGTLRAAGKASLELTSILIISMLSNIQIAGNGRSGSYAVSSERLRAGRSRNLRSRRTGFGF